MSKLYWEKQNNSGCPGKPIVKNECYDGTIVLGKRLSGGLSEQEHLKLSGIEDNAQVNILEGICMIPSK